MSNLQAKLIDFGILDHNEDLERKPDEKSTTGYTLAADAMKVVRRTDKIEMKPGVAFGIKYQIDGEEQDGEVAYQRRIMHPAIQNPNDGEIYIERVDIRGEQAGTETFDFFRFDQEYEMKVGEWTFQLLDGPEVLLEKTFHLE